MDRILQPTQGASPFGSPSGRGPVTPVRMTGAPATLPPKSTGDYVRAVRKKIGLVLAIAIIVGVPGSIYMLRRPNVYRGTATIRIEPPEFDPRIATMMPHGAIGATSRDAVEHYVPDRLAELRGRALAEKAAADPSLHLPPDAIEEVASTLVLGLTTRRHADSNTFDIMFEWTDGERVAPLLNALLSKFKETALITSGANIDRSKELASQNLQALERNLKSLNETIAKEVINSPFTNDGKNMLQDQLLQYNTLLMQKRVRGDEMIQQQRLMQFTPRKPTGDHPFQARISTLTEQKQYFTEQLEEQRRVVKHFDSDPSSKYYAKKLQKTLEELEHLQSVPVEQESDLLSMFLSHHSEDVQKLEREVKGLQSQIQASMPKYERFLTLLRDRESLQKNYDDLKQRQTEFEFLSRTQNEPVQVLQLATDPTAPVRPNRALLIAVVVIMSLALGIGTVCGLESLDRRVKVPEHVVAGLTVPLLAVIPWMRRLARFHQGGHICAYKDPLSHESDAFRNLRASLVGVPAPRGGSITSLLIASAKPGEGKTTTALNLAAACARSGERTLLMEVDLRNPSLAGVFEPDHEFGLVDALRGELPWQKTIVRSDDVPLLDYMPCGDPRGVPVEALGTIEMRQLLLAVSKHYHRVILDGPAILGLADCRILGQLVDAAILVVRCGAHDLSPLQRAKGMLDLSRVPLVGAVFNALDDDFQNWSSHTVGMIPAASLSEARVSSRGLPRAEPTSV